MPKSELLNGGELYDIMVNWDKRIKKEVPFLESHLNTVKNKKNIILEVACGTGHHLLELAKKGYKVTGLDIDHTMIAVAEKRLSKYNVKLYTRDFLADEPSDFKYESFDGVYCLGNAVGLIAQSYGYEVIIEKFSKLLRKNGILIFQILNTEKERNGWSKPNGQKTKVGEYIFLRGFKTTEKTLNPEILTLFRKNESSEWQLLSIGSARIPRVGKNEMVELLEKNHFGNIRVYGNYQAESFDPDVSLDMIFVCEKLD
ncbi:MAG: class I SAM-dependent methyltransferase [Candidatus Hodarchaeales archaeon]